MVVVYNKNEEKHFIYRVEVIYDSFSFHTIVFINIDFIIDAKSLSNINSSLRAYHPEI